MHIDIVILSLIIDSFPLSPQLLQQWMYKQDLMNRYCGFDVCGILSLSECRYRTCARGISSKYILMCVLFYTLFSDYYFSVYK